jgi:hypothetical protein
MSKKNINSKSRLGLNLFEANLKRHPSVKGLFDEDGNKKKSKDSKNELLLLNIDNKSENESNDTSNNNEEDEEKFKIKEVPNQDIEIEKDKAKIKRGDIRKMSVKIERVKEKIVDNKETFFVEMKDEDRKNIIKKNDYNKKNNSKFNSSKPLSYGFDDKQKEFDKNITDAIKKGKEYSEIEGKFLGQLKK